MPKALILGCSHATGAEMFMHTDRDNNDGYLHSYPAQIARALGFTIENRAISGGSNDAMYRIFESEQKNLTKDDIVIACWTGSNRTEVYSDEDDAWVSFCAGIETFYCNKTLHFNDPNKIKDQTLYHYLMKQWITHDSNSWRWRINKIKNIVALNSIAILRDITVLNFYSFNHIDYTEGYDIYDFEWPVGCTEFTTWAHEQGFERTSLGHYYLDAHKAFCEYVLTNKNKSV